MTSNGIDIGFDIGGTNMRLAQIRQGGLGEVHKIPTPQNPEEAVRVFFAQARAIAGKESVGHFVGGIPGVIDDMGAITEPSPNLSEWRNFPFGARVRKEFGAAFEVHNDAQLAALGEAVYGAGKRVDIVGYVGFGTGIGGARIVHGSLDASTSGFEPGRHIVNVETGANWEAYASGSALSKKYGMKPVDLPRSAYDEIVPAVAMGIYNIIALWSPGIVVLGGSLVTGKNGFDIAEITDALHALPPIFPQLPEIRTAELGDLMALHGARALCFNVQ